MRNNWILKYKRVKPMKRIWEFFENMNEIVYVSDIDTHELIYMNHRARELYGGLSLDELKGSKCHELLQGSASPCSICTNKHLKPGYFEEWKYYNPVLGKYFMLKDTMVEDGGRFFRVELAIDLSEQEKQQEVIKEHIDNETIINEGLRLSLSSPSANGAIDILIEYVGKALKCDRIYIFERKAGDLYDNTYEWCAIGVEPQLDLLKNLTKEDMAAWMNYFRNGRNVIINDLEEIKESDPGMYDILYPQDIHSLVASPLVYKDNIIGFYGVDNPPFKLMDSISTLFMILGHFIVSLMRRRDLIKRLEMLSYYDQLTGCGNRHAMDDCIAGMQPEKSVGIVYCDVTGLKRINDAQGHKAGDALLLRASESLKRAFPDYKRFRIGGDEFLVLCSGILEEELNERVKKLKKDMVENEAPMAIGLVWRAKYEENMNKLLAEADERMYEDKRKYYADIARI
jgi:diguanylate cyclase (GGDEF)-like protein